jgi:hypothetical protein
MQMMFGIVKIIECIFFATTSAQTLNIILAVDYLTKLKCAAYEHKRNELRYKFLQCGTIKSLFYET